MNLQQTVILHDGSDWQSTARQSFSNVDQNVSLNVACFLYTCSYIFLTFVSPVGVPGVGNKPIVHTALNAPSQNLHSVTSFQGTCPMLVHTYISTDMITLKQKLNRYTIMYMEGYLENDEKVHITSTAVLFINSLPSSPPQGSGFVWVDCY